MIVQISKPTTLSESIQFLTGGGLSQLILRDCTHQSREGVGRMLVLEEVAEGFLRLVAEFVLGALWWGGCRSH